MRDIGQALKQARQEKNYSLKDIQQMTHIQTRYLLAIEENRWDELPEGIYRRSFIRQYAEIVNLDLKELTSQLSDSERDALKEGTTLSKDTEYPSRKMRRYHSKYSAIDRFFNAFPSILIVLLVGIVIIALYFAWRQYSDQNQADSIFSSSTTVTETQQSDISAPAETREETEMEADGEENSSALAVDLLSSEGSDTVYQLTTTGEELAFSLEADEGQTWLDVMVDGEVYTSQMLSQGESYQATIPESFEELLVTVGNAPATTLQINGVLIEYPEIAETTALQNITFIKESEGE